MKFKAKTSDLQQVLSKVAATVPAKSALPILENILFDLMNNTLTVTATDMEVSLAASCDVQGTEDGRIAIPARRLMDTIRALDSKSEPQFSADTTTNKITITTSNGHYSLTGEGAKEFPQTPRVKSPDDTSIAATTIKRLIYRTSFAVSTDELRPAMTGVLLQSKGSELRAVATDGHRLVRVVQKLAHPSGFRRDIIIPAKALHILGKFIDAGDVTISVSETHISFTFDKTVLVSRLIDETYPNYESVIPTENDKRLNVDRDAIMASIRRVSLYSSATTHQVKFDISNSTVAISAQDIDYGGEARESVQCEYNGEKLEIGFNSVYVQEILSHLEAGTVVFKFSSATRAGIVVPAKPTEDEDITMLVMPVRLTT
jgi:DNA polymerase-3 subunit beta